MHQEKGDIVTEEDLAKKMKRQAKIDMKHYKNVNMVNAKRIYLDDLPENYNRSSLPNLPGDYGSVNSRKA